MKSRDNYRGVRRLTFKKFWRESKKGRPAGAGFVFLWRAINDNYHQRKV